VNYYLYIGMKAEANVLCTVFAAGSQRENALPDPAWLLLHGAYVTQLL